MMQSKEMQQFKVSIGGSEIGKIRVVNGKVQASGNTSKILNIIEAYKHADEPLTDFLRTAPYRFHGHLKFEKCE